MPAINSGRGINAGWTARGYQVSDRRVWMPNQQSAYGACWLRKGSDPKSRFRLPGPMGGNFRSRDRESETGSADWIDRVLATRLKGYQRTLRRCYQPKQLHVDAELGPSSGCTSSCGIRFHALITSEDWQQALAVGGPLSRLLVRQHPAHPGPRRIFRGFQPSRVAGYRTWRKMGRQVRRGERGLAILAPVTCKIEPSDGEEEERRVVGFRVVHVFDLSQTDGEPLPEVRTALVEGDLPAH